MILYRSPLADMYCSQVNNDILSVKKLKCCGHQALAPGCREFNLCSIACNIMGYSDKHFLPFDSVLKMVLDFEWIDQALDFFLSTTI